MNAKHKDIVKLHYDAAQWGSVVLCRPQTLEQLRLIAKRDGGWNCHYCQKELISLDGDKEYYIGPKRDIPTIDHKSARSFGGKDKLENFVLACSYCNNHKGSKSYKEYIKEIQEIRRWSQPPDNFNTPVLPAQVLEKFMRSIS